MDHRASAVEEDLKDILQTRMALADKLQRLEQRVEETVQGTKMAALGVIGHAKHKAAKLVESATQTFDPAAQVRRRPWLLVGGAIAIGLLAGWAERRRKSSGVYAYYPPDTKGADIMPSEATESHHTGVYPFYSRESDGGARKRARQTGAEGSRRGSETLEQVSSQVSSLWREFTSQLAKERHRLQQAALETGRSFLQDMAHSLAQSLVDSLTRRPERASRYEPGSRP